MARKRDYRAEYARRIERALRDGYSRSVARGHPSKRKGEISLSRARSLHIPRGTRIIRDPGDVRHGYRPTYADIRRRLRSLNLHFSLEALKGKRGRIPKAFMRDRHGDSFLNDDETREEFVNGLQLQGFTSREAYTLLFSP